MPAGKNFHFEDSGDYYLLSEENFSADGWTVSQFSAHDGSGGVVAAVRNP